MSRPSDLTNATAAAEAFLGRSEDASNPVAAAAQASAAATLAVAYQLGRIADALDDVCDRGRLHVEGSVVHG